MMHDGIKTKYAEMVANIIHWNRPESDNQFKFSTMHAQKVWCWPLKMAPQIIASSIHSIKHSSAARNLTVCRQRRQRREKTWSMAAMNEIQFIIELKKRRRRSELWYTLHSRSQSWNDGVSNCRFRDYFTKINDVANGAKKGAGDMDREWLFYPPWEKFSLLWAFQAMPCAPIQPS